MQDTQKNFYKKLLGRNGERQAEKYLKENGYVILERNYATKVGEIDIIAKDNEVLCFCEVKTRSKSTYGEPSEAVNARKIEKYYKVAQQYLSFKDEQDCQCRFDVIEILDGKINLIKDAFSR